MNQEKKTRIFGLIFKKWQEGGGILTISMRTHWKLACRIFNLDLEEDLLEYTFFCSRTIRNEMDRYERGGPKPTGWGIRRGRRNDKNPSSRWYRYLEGIDEGRTLEEIEKEFELECEREGNLD